MKKTASTKTAKATKVNKATKATPKRKKAATVQPVEAQPVENTETQPVETTEAQTEQKELTGIALHFANLREISEQARQIKISIIEQAETPERKEYFTTRPLNFFILNCIYNGGQEQFKTFDEWKNEGAHVNKGEKAYVIWGLPVAKEAATDDHDQPTERILNFPISFVFSSSQVTFKNQPKA